MEQTNNTKEQSLYAQYVLERENKHTIEKDYGFAFYKFENDYCYIVDIYTVPEMRNGNKATELADEIVKIAKSKGYNKLIGSISPMANNHNISLKVLAAYGFELLQSTKDMVYFIKEI